MASAAFAPNRLLGWLLSFLVHGAFLAFLFSESPGNVINPLP